MWLTAFPIGSFPKKLVFILQDRSGNVQHYGYRTLKPYDFKIDISTLDQFEPFFIQYPQTLQFELFEFKFEHPETTEKLKSFNPEIVVPIVGLNGLYGIILVSSKIFEPHYFDEELHYLDRLMNFTSITIQNNIHYLSAVTDAKTHLFNHGFLSSASPKRLPYPGISTRDLDSSSWISTILRASTITTGIWPEIWLSRASPRP
jgi:hypothetical protein